MNLIEQAVLPLKEQAIKHAEEYALATIENIRKELEANDWQDRKIAPYPSYSSGLSGIAYNLALARYHLVQSLVSWCESTRSNIPGVIHRCTINPVKCQHFIKETKENAAAQYLAFVQKLNVKIGPVTSATLEGSHVWDYSFLHVTKEDGIQETWKTQMIVNVSKLGKVFNQFPTRKMKKPL